MLHLLKTSFSLSFIISLWRHFDCYVMWSCNDTSESRLMAAMNSKVNLDFLLIWFLHLHLYTNVQVITKLTLPHVLWYQKNDHCFPILSTDLKEKFEVSILLIWNHFKFLYRINLRSTNHLPLVLDDAQ